MDDLVAWLTTRINEDEQVALAARTRHEWDDGYESFDELSDGSLVAEGDPAVTDGAGPFATAILVAVGNGPTAATVVEHAARWNPDRVLTEAEAKREMVSLAAMYWRDGANAKGSPRLLAQVSRQFMERLVMAYRTYPGFRPEWAQGVLTARSPAGDRPNA